MHAAMQIPAGRLADRVGARRIGLAGVAIVVVCNGLALVAPSPALAIAMRTLTGIGTAVCFVAGSDYIRASGGSVFAQGVFGAAGVGSGGLALAIVPQVARVPSTGGRPTRPRSASRCSARSRSLLGPSDRGHERPQRTHELGRLWTDRRLLRLAAIHSASFGLSVLLGDWVVTLLERAGGLSPGSPAGSAR